MTSKKGKPDRKIATLRVRTLNSNLTARVKGGPCPGTNTRPVRPVSI